MTSYRSEWLNPDDNKWRISWEGTDKNEAKKEYQRDRDYFYNDIKVRLVEVRTRTLIIANGLGGER